MERSSYGVALLTLPERISQVLAPHLGEVTSDTVARHICAKYGITDSPTPQQLEQLKDFLRRGLVAYVGSEKAEALATACVSAAS